MLFLFVVAIKLSKKNTYTKEVYRKPTEFYKNVYFISFEKSLYGLTFKNDTPEFLKPKIIKFIKAKKRNYTDLGIYKLKIVNRNDKIYLVESEKPKKLILLD